MDKSLLDLINNISSYKSYKKTTTITESMDLMDDGSIKSSSSSVVEEILTPIEHKMKLTTTHDGRVRISARGRKPIKKISESKPINKVRLLDSAVGDIVLTDKKPKTRDDDNKLGVCMPDDIRQSNETDNVVKISEYKGA